MLLKSFQTRRQPTIKCIIDFLALDIAIKNWLKTSRSTFKRDKQKPQQKPPATMVALTFRRRGACRTTLRRTVKVYLAVHICGEGSRGYSTEKEHHELAHPPKWVHFGVHLGQHVPVNTSGVSGLAHLLWSSE